jgi:hypothetical protein
MVAAGKMLTTILSRARQKRTESGLNRNTDEGRFFKVTDIRISLLTRVSDADRERTEAVPGNSSKFFRIWWPGTELNRRRQPFQCAL